MSRHERRKLAKEKGLNWRANQEAVRMQRRLEAGVLRLSPAKARELLALWASQTGRSQEEIDAMNARISDAR